MKSHANPYDQNASRHVIDSDDLGELRPNYVYDVQALSGGYFVRAGFAIGGNDERPKRPEVPQTDARRDTLMAPLDEWSVFQVTQPNALLIGSAANANAAILRLLPYLRAPVVHWHPRAMAEFTPQPTGALVVWDVDTLDRTQQELLLAWMDSHGADLQVISVAEVAVFPLVLRKAFIDTLYYRLNMVCLNLANNLGIALDAHSPMNVSRVL